MEIRGLHAGDLDTAATLLQAAYGRPDTWRQEVERYLPLPGAGWFGAWRSGELLGVGGTIDYGRAASIGLMGVLPEAQGQGIGSGILEHILAWLRDRRCPFAFLDASAAGAPLYERFGFQDEGVTGLWQGEAQPGSVQSTERASLQSITRLDAAITGLDRSALLATLFQPDRSFQVGRTGEPHGYIMAQQRIIGPWIAIDREVAVTLLQAALSLPFTEKPVVLAPDANSDVGALLQEHSFTLQRSLRHMVLPLRPGARQPGDRHRILGEASFATG